MRWLFPLHVVGGGFFVISHESQTRRILRFSNGTDSLVSVDVSVVAPFGVTNRGLLTNVWNDIGETPNEKPKAVIWKCQRNNTVTACSSVEKDFHYPILRPEPHSLTMADRISTIGWKYMPEVTFFGMYEQWEKYNFQHPLVCYLSCLKPYTVVWVDSHVFKKFWDDILPQIQVPIVLFSADGDESHPLVDISDPEQVAKLKLKIPQWYVHNCKPEVLQHLDWITCVPIGLSQMDNNIQRNQIHAALSLRWGNYGKLLSSNDIDNNRIYDEVTSEKDANNAVGQNAVLVAFSVGNNEKQRQPVMDWFCDSPNKISPFHKLGGGTATCKLENKGNQNHHLFYHTSIGEHRFVASPMGAGFDCYRTYEILMMGSYPIVQTSQNDVLYKVTSLLPPSILPSPLPPFESDWIL